MIPTRIGQATHGGYFAGIIRHRNIMSALIVSSKQYEIAESHGVSCIGTTSTTDGYTNTYSSHISSNSIDYCKGLSINEYSDWYLPSVVELQLVSKNLFNTNLPVSIEPNSSIVGKCDRESLPVVVRFLFRCKEGIGSLRLYWSSTFTQPNVSCCTNLTTFSTSHYHTSFVHYVRPVRKHEITL